MTTDTSWYGYETLAQPDPGYAYQYDPVTQQYTYVPVGFAPEQDPYAAAQGYDSAYAYGYDASVYAYPVPEQYQGGPQYDGYSQVACYDQQFAAMPASGPGAVWAEAVPSYAPEDAAGFGDGAESTSLLDPSVLLLDHTTADPSDAHDPADPADAFDADADEQDEAEQSADQPDADQPDLGPRAARRRSAPRKRSTLLKVGVPSVAFLGMAGTAAAVMAPAGSSTASAASASAATQANSAASAKASALAASAAQAAAERASRDQQRTALQLRQAAAKKKAAEAPRYTLPIAFHTGLSALFGQAGTHWSRLHTGIDFPVSVGTPVHAVTAGTVTTEWNPFYGYMVKLTAPDGTVTWYCHLSRYKVRSGKVNVGDVIAYSGDTGNSTGPHLHFEVHPAGGDAIDPLPWLLAHGLDPR
ncbi:M23 family metallopeptidase [Streptacidiphilus monticola]|uniref:M23 family metallopeptidase n=1 Tax=Streptacidiphilus monticola TaxID=2161674 RepID=A0ABW1FYE9_9ACTN